jgi:hypothetical protein
MPTPAMRNASRTATVNTLRFAGQMDEPTTTHAEPAVPWQRLSSKENAMPAAASHVRSSVSMVLFRDPMAVTSANAPRRLSNVLMPMPQT